ncbi:hypothetical protein Taro_030467 [Colocasia esculenta]|uniref:Uncharacterized protein n=1 Tax=Colocasia esculenta TaxID=4460 RepID=A0A843W3E6_COLES|nr:hypothetical protein [Colocasia esculenta]
MHSGIENLSSVLGCLCLSVDRYIASVDRYTQRCKPEFCLGMTVCICRQVEFICRQIHLFDRFLCFMLISSMLHVSCLCTYMQIHC